MEDQKLARYLKAARVKAGLTQKEVSDRLNYKTSQFVSNWERGHSIPPLNALKTIAKLYKVNLNDLFEQILSASIFLTEQLMRKQFSQLKKRK